MLKIVGIIFLLVGAVGFSYSLCNDRRKQLQLLKEIRYFYQLMMGEMQYTRMPLPLIFKNLSPSLREPLGSIILQIGEGMTPEQEKDFSDVWEIQIQKGFLGSPLTKEQKKALMRFPEFMNLADCDGQTTALQRQIAELDGWIGQLEEESKSKNKVIMSLGIATGMFLVILLI